jgi:AraC-like DNA-binding protein
MKPSPSPPSSAPPRSRPPSAEATAHSSWARLLALALRARGRDPAPLFASAGLDLASIEDPDARLPARAFSRLWQLAVEATGDPCFGLEVARQISATTFQGLGFAALSSTTLREVLERVARYHRVVGDALAARLEDRGGTYRFVAEGVSTPPPAPEAFDALFAIVVRACRILTDRSFSPLAVELRRPAPPDPSPFARCFRAPVTFSAPRDALVLDPAACDRRLRTANPEVARANEETLARALAQMSVARTMDRVRAQIVERLPSGEPSQAEVARALGSSTRALQRRLSAEGTTYARLVDETRRDLAIAYVREGRAMTEIAYLLGFSGANSFTRAFRRWTDQAPSEYRRGL